jgi:hypothetical protein
LLEAYIVSSKRFLTQADVWQFVDCIAKMLICFRKIDGESGLSDLTNRCPKFDEKDWDCLNRIKHLVSNGSSI